MQLLLDHLVSVVVGSAVILLLATTSVDQRRRAAEATWFHAAKQQQLAFVDMVERDFRGIGEGVPVTAAVVVESADGRFRYRRALDDGAVVDVEYRRELASLADGDTLYRVVRYVGGVATGQSGDALTSFEVGLRDVDGAPVTSDLADARTVDVRVEAAVPAGVGGPVRRLAWASTFRPLSLARLDG